jgi:hypothetical protein
VKRQDREYWVRAKVVISRPFRASFEATTKSHERDQRRATADRVRIVEAIGLRTGVRAELFRCEITNNISLLFGFLAEGTPIQIELKAT